MDLLVIEDDAILGKAVQRGLLEAGHQCEWVRSDDVPPPVESGIGGSEGF